MQIIMLIYVYTRVCIYIDIYLYVYLKSNNQSLKIHCFGENYNEFLTSYLKECKPRNSGTILHNC